MQFGAECVTCLLDRQAEMAKHLGSDREQLQFLRELMQSVLDAPEGVAAPYLVPIFAESFSRHFGISDPYQKIKKESNRRVLQLLPELEKLLAGSPDPLRLALQFSQTGNYLDFAVLPEDRIDAELENAVRRTPENPLDEEEYRHFLKELGTARHLLILGDNAGEIVFDRLLVEQLHSFRPDLDIAYCVRGGNAQNDATREDARASGMDRAARIVDNGSSIPGIELSFCSEELLSEMNRADLIISKGQANFECLLSCGMNIYYIFLCKCPRFCSRFRVEPMTGMFINERRTDLCRFSPDAVV